jgi:tetratricopeptide (TPR) repeat protein
MVIGERGDEGDATNAPDCLEGVAADAAKARISDIATRATMEAKYWRLGSGGPLDVEELRMAAEEAKSLSDEVGRCRAYYHLAFCCSIVGKWDEAARLLERALEHARRAGDPQEQGEVLWFLTGALEHGSMPAREALARLGELLDPARTPNLSARERTLIEAVGRAPLLAMAGELDAAHTLCDHAKAICDDTGQRLRRATVRQVTGRVALLARRLAQANADLDLSFEILDAMGETGFLATTAGLRAEARYLERKPRETLASARVARKAASTDDIEAQVLWAVACAKVMANLGERDWARRLAECAVKSASQSDDLNLRADGELAAAEVAAAEGLLDEVRAKVAAAQKLYEDKGNVVGKRNAAALEERLTGGLRSGRPRNTGASTRH